MPAPCCRRDSAARLAGAQRQQLSNSRSHCIVWWRVRCTRLPTTGSSDLFIATGTIDPAVPGLPTPQLHPTRPADEFTVNPNPTPYIMIRAIFFDLDHTLCDTSGADRQAHADTIALVEAERPDIDAQGLMQTFRDLLSTEPFDPAGGDTVEWRSELFARALQQQNAKAPELAARLSPYFHQRRIENFDYFPGAVPLLAALRETHKLVVITNGTSEIQRPKLVKCNVNAHVDHILVSGETPWWKPDPGIFLHACELAQCAAAEAIHVGDSMEADVCGGINAALAATVWIAPDHTAAPDPRPDFTVASVLALPEILQQLQ